MVFDKMFFKRKYNDKLWTNTSSIIRLLVIIIIIISSTRVYNTDKGNFSTKNMFT